MRPMKSSQLTSIHSTPVSSGPDGSGAGVGARVASLHLNLSGSRRPSGQSHVSTPDGQRRAQYWPQKFIVDGSVAFLHCADAQPDATQSCANQSVQPLGTQSRNCEKQGQKSLLVDSMHACSAARHCR